MHYSVSKLGDKNPAKRPEVRNKISKTIHAKFENDSGYRDKISASLINFFEKSDSFLKKSELTDFAKFKWQVDNLTSKNKRKLFKNWNGFDFYDDEYILDNLKLHYNSQGYPTVDHKISVVFGFKNKYSPEYISSLDNLCITKRKLNNEKYTKSEVEFKKKLEQQFKSTL